MWNRIRHLQRDERGMSYVFVGLGFIAFMTASTLAIDVGLAMTARGQSQNAADAGALAGATALAFNSFTDHSAGGPAVQSAINSALANSVAGGTVSVTAGDVTFPTATRVRVQVFRSGTRGNAVPTFIAPIFGVRSMDVGATATAEASPANAETCVKPFTIPDRWIENKNPPWTTDSTFDRYYQNGPNKGQVIPNADVYIPVGQPGYRGYNSDTDKGTPLTIRAGTGNNVSPSMYFSWAMPSNTGGDDYRENIAGCNTTLVHFGDQMTQEPGNMVGPTDQGVDDLMALDPNARWDTSCNCVKDSAYGVSPRVFPIPLYDPDYYQSGVTNGRGATLRVANWIGFFLVGRQGNDVLGRITPILGMIDGNAGPAPVGSFPIAIRLVE